MCCNACLDQDEYDMRHSLSKRKRLQRDPDYGDWELKQEKNREMDELDVRDEFIKSLMKEEEWEETDAYPNME